MKLQTHLTQTALAFLLLFSPAAAQDGVRHITQAEALKAAVSKPQPEYPAIARQLKVEGKVELEVSIRSDGNVDAVKILTGNATLTGSAVNAVKRWHFEPLTLEGKPIRAVAVLSFTFKL